MNVPELALHHQRLDQRSNQLRSQIARLEAELAGDPVADRLDSDRATAEASRRDLELRLRQRERDAEGRRARLRARERDLMGGRIRNPTELMKLSQEVEHLKAALVEEEDAQLELMEELEGLERELGRLNSELTAARERTEAAAPDLRARLERQRGELSRVEAEREATWAEVPAEWQEAYRRVSRRQPDPVAEVVGGQCQACRVAVTSSGKQALRRAGLLLCDNCGRILVVA